MSAQPDPDHPGQPVAVLTSAPSSSSSQAPEHLYRKIARLLKVFRDLINHLLDDSVPYHQSREILHLKKYRQAAAKAAALELKKLDPNREFTEREDQILTERMDNFFKKPRRKKPQTNEPPAATAKPPISTFSDNQGARTTE